jgi:hypothetical protein
MHLLCEHYSNPLKFRYQHRSPFTPESTLPSEYLDSIEQDLITEFQAQLEQLIGYDYKTRKCKVWGSSDVPHFQSLIPGYPKTMQKKNGTQRFITAIKLKGEFSNSLRAYRYGLFCINNHLCYTGKVVPLCEHSSKSFIEERCMECGQDLVLELFEAEDIRFMYGEHPPNGFFGNDLADCVKMFEQLRTLRIRDIDGGYEHYYGRSVDTIEVLAQPQTFMECGRFRAIHGPPGTGKSRFIVDDIIRQREEDQESVLVVTAMTNQAVAVCLEKYLQQVYGATSDELSLKDSGILVLGAADNVKIRKVCQPFLLTTQLESDPEYQAGRLALQQHWDSLRGRQTKAFKKLARQLCREFIAMKERLVRRIHNKTTICFGTVTELRRLTVDEELGERVSTIYVDEASMLPEWRTIIFGCIPRDISIVVLGDHEQLQPIDSIASIRNGMFRRNQPEAFFQRVSRFISDPMFMLTKQYRMQRDICTLVSQMTYDGKVETDPSVDSRVEKLLAYAKVMSGVHWINHNHPEQQPEGMHGYWNQHEISVAVDIVESLDRVGSFVDGRSVAIITFYQAQRVSLEEQLQCSSLSRYMTQEDALLKVATVDSKQGSEAEVVILNMVSSNNDKKV